MSTPTDLTGSEQEPSGKDKEVYRLRLYITGMSSQSMQALTNLKRVCDKYLVGRYELEVIDLQRQHESVAEDGFIVAPMLIKNSPLPMRKLVGNLANTRELLRRLGIADDMVTLPQ